MKETVRTGIIEEGMKGVREGNGFDEEGKIERLRTETGRDKVLGKGVRTIEKDG